MMNVFRVNCVVTRELIPFLKEPVASNPEGKMGCKKAVVVQMSTAVASIAENASGGNYAYRRYERFKYVNEKCVD
uniref:Uncharacterized protein n=1 Tax=Lepeophtheirus salmonis TaxID=72036 RepID=A0A0K2V9Y9_LEPSM